MGNGEALVLLQWPSGIIFVGNYLGKTENNMIIAERLVSLQPGEHPGDYILVPQPLPIDLITLDLMDCPHYINPDSLALYGIYPMSKDHPILTLYQDYWSPEDPEKSEPTSDV